MTNQNEKSNTQFPQPPKADKVTTTFNNFGDIRQDDYFWLNQRDNPDVIRHLELENNYTDEILAPIQELKSQISEEMRSRIAPDDESVPYFLNDYWYYSRVQTNEDYPIHCRKKGTRDDFASKKQGSPEEIMLDMNIIAKGLDCCVLGYPKVSPDNTKLTYGIDTKGNRLFSLFIKDLNTGKTTDLNLNDVSNAVWSSDGQSIVYCVKHPQTLRDYRIYAKKLSGDSEPQLIHEELNESYDLGIFKTTSREYIVIQSEQSNVSSEALWIPSNDVFVKPVIFRERRDKVEYDIDHINNYWFIRTNEDAPNFKIMTSQTGSRWAELISHEDNIYINGILATKNFLAISLKANCQDEIKLFNFDDGGRLILSETHNQILSQYKGVVGFGANADPESRMLRFAFTSLVEPFTTFDYDINNQKIIKRKQQNVPNYDSSKYTTWTEQATSKDGTKILITLLGSKSDSPKKDHPTILYGYGAYGLSSDPYFMSNVFSLIDRGFIFAIAHIRGGQEGGRKWYEQGKMKNKVNTFTDFISCADRLIELGITDSSKIGAYGGSAGGLLVGAVLNMRPDLFRFAIAQVPFVDILTTMFDDTLPLTVGEYTEWGNPNIEADYKYMRQYSPYDNIVAQSYPAIYVSTGIHDSQVQYFEPAKWVQKLRELKTDQSPIVMRCEMGAGHGGKSGRYKSLEDVAERYAFVVGIVNNLM